MYCMRHSYLLRNSFIWISNETASTYSILLEALSPSTLCSLSSVGGREVKFPPYTTGDIVGLKRLGTKALLLRATLSTLRLENNLLKSFLSFHT